MGALWEGYLVILWRCSGRTLKVAHTLTYRDYSTGTAEPARCAHLAGRFEKRPMPAQWAERH